MVSTQTLGELALHYAADGRSIIPLYGMVPNRGTGELICACREPCGKSAGKHPLRSLVPNGLTNATKHPAVITSWWAAASLFAKGRQPGMIRRGRVW